MPWHTEEEVVRQLAPVVEYRNTALRVERGDAAARDELDPALGEGREERAGGVRGRRNRAWKRKHERDLALLANPVRRQIVVQEQRALTWCGRALERRSADADDRTTLREAGKHSGQPLRAGRGVELVASVGEPRRSVHVVVGPERHDQEVRLVGLDVGRHRSRDRIDRGDRLLQKAHSGLGEVAIWETSCFHRRPAKQHVELRVPEDERVALVDQRDCDAVAERLRKNGCELETSEPRTENQDAARHYANLAHTERR